MAIPRFHHPLLALHSDAVAAGVLADTQQTRQAFVAALRRALAVLPGANVRIDAKTLTARSGDGREDWLQHRWDTLRCAPTEARDEMIVAMARSLVAPQREPRAVSPGTLVPRIRHRYHHHALRLQEEYDARWSAPPLIWPLGSHLSVELVFDRETVMTTAGPAALASVGLTRTAAWEVALDNLRGRTSDDALNATGPGVFTLRVGDCLDSSRLLLTDRIRALQVEGAHVALPASRDTLVITGDEDPSGLETLLSEAVTCVHSPRLDTVTPLRLSAAGWQTWLPEGGPLGAAWSELSRRARAGHHAHQRSLLARLHEQRGVAMTISPLGIRALADGVETIATWPPDEALLPRADRVLVATEEGLPAVEVPWWALEAVCGELLVPAGGLWPPLFYARRPPDLERRIRLAALVAHADGADA